jgi:hypothetical protein
MDTVSLIHNSSCNPNEHKLGSIKYLMKRLRSYTIFKQVATTELEQ